MVSARVLCEWPTVPEVKGRIAGAETLMVTGSGILHALEAHDARVLAHVEVSPAGAVEERVPCASWPFGGTMPLPFSSTATMLSWPDYWQRGTDPS